ncbi:MAG: amidase family protein [Pseudomonadota bacterium]
MPPLSPDDAADLSAADLARAYREGRTDPVAVTEACLSRIAAAQGSCIFITVTAERARAEAAAAKARYDAGTPASPLDGVPVAWKDLFDVAGTVTTVGSELFRHGPVAEADAVAVKNLCESGLVCLGKVNLSEFAFSALGLNPHFGTPENPHDRATARAPGGSSSGSAVAVAAGLAPIAIGSDTGGSVRVPAAFNGLIGAKSSFGRISIAGGFPLAASLDTVGPLCRTVEDAIFADAALRGVSQTVPTADLSALTLIVPDTFFFDDCEPAVVEAVEAAIQRLEAAGATLKPMAMPDVVTLSKTLAEHGTVVAAEAYQLHAERVEGPDVEEIDGRIVARILRGKAMSANDLVAIHQARTAAKGTLAAAIGEAFVVMPTVAHVAPAIAPLDADPDLFAATNVKTLRNTTIGNLLDWPGVALPAASASPMPVSLLVSGISGGDERVLAAARAMEMVVAGR